MRNFFFQADDGIRYLVRSLGLEDVYKRRLWQQPRDVRLLGLLHSVYGNAFVDLVKFDPASERARLRDLVGE